jgi:hypothetical protein
MHTKTEQEIIVENKNNIKLGKYPRLSYRESEIVRKYHSENCKITKQGWQGQIEAIDGMVFANGYERVVVGDYGAYIEISPTQVIQSAIMVAPGQEYRLTEKFKNCKYTWLTDKGGKKAKIYLQRGLVTYADYKIGMYYVSPEDVKLNIRQS